MRTFENFNDYELIDADCGERLERWGDIILIRPDPQIIWNEGHRDERWNSAHAKYHRSNSGGGYWETLKKVPDVWSIKYNDLTFRLKPMGFKHTGLFPEQAVNWSLADKLIREANREISVLNLFAYTGGATIACLNAGAKVTHVDASKGMVSWAKENAVASGLADRPVRWLVDDCMKFVKREIRRGNKYDIILMDPPSFGRGANKEVWNIETDLYDLVEKCTKILSDDPILFLINSYTTGLSMTILENILNLTVNKIHKGVISSDELGIKEVGRELILPCGIYARWEKI